MKWLRIYKDSVFFFFCDEPFDPDDGLIYNFF